MTSNIKVWGLEPREIEAIVQKGVARRKRESFAAGEPWPVKHGGRPMWEWPDGSFTETIDRPNHGALAAGGNNHQLAAATSQLT